MARIKQKAQYKPGEWILIPFRPDPLEAEILEDMGCLGADGEHVYFIRVPEGEHGEEEYTQTIGERWVVGPADRPVPRAR
jgi:hypothetical protein